MSKFCVFCEIASDGGQESVVYDDGTVMAFMDSHPANVGHTLIIPKEHWKNIYEIPESELSNVFKVVKKVSVAVKKAVNAEGINILQNNEKAAFQSVKHFHVHVIPRFRGDAITNALSLLGPMEFKKVTHQEIKEIAAKIKRNL